jgi:phosphatidylglycerol---prolipoprotein diacylglyceryl transferase
MLGYVQFPSWIKPEVFWFWNWSVPRWYGIMYIAAFVVSYLLFMHQLKKRPEPVNRDMVLDLFFWGVIGLIVGARLAFVFIYDTTHELLRQPWRIIIPVQRGADGRVMFTGLSGMSYHGGLVGIIIAVTIYMRVKKIDILEWSDMLTAGIPLGYTFGRLGNFINGELYGRVTASPLGMVFPDAQRFSGKEQWVKDFASAVGMPPDPSGMQNLPRFPSQLFEAFFEGIVLWLILWFIVKDRKPFKGFVVACYIMGYGIFRFFIEYTREPDIGIGYPITFQRLENPGQFSFFNFSTGQILCFIMIAAAVVCLVVFGRRARAVQPLPDSGQPSARKLRKKAQKGV